MLLVRCEASVHANGDGEFLRLVSDLRHRFPGSPVALWIPHADPDQVIELVRMAIAAQVRGVIGGAEPRPESLRRQMTSPDGISAFVLRWASDVGYLPPAPSLHDELNTLLEAAPNVRTLERLARERQAAARTWRGRLRQMGLPTPRAWLGLAHALHVAFFLQRRHDEPLERLAVELRYPDVSRMHHQFQRVFHMSPGAVRSLLGAEPLLHRWFAGLPREATR